MEKISDGLGPLYNAQSCRECHQNPASGGVSQTTELRVGHLDRNGQFENPSIPINHRKEAITGRTLVNDRAICPDAAFPDIELQEQVPDSEKVRTTRLSLNLWATASWKRSLTRPCSTSPRSSAAPNRATFAGRPFMCPSSKPREKRASGGSAGRTAD